MTFSRVESDLLELIMIRLATDNQLAAEFVELGSGVKTIQTRAKRMWKNINRRIEKRDAAQRRKENVAEVIRPGDPDSSEQDVPLF